MDLSKEKKKLLIVLIIGSIIMLIFIPFNLVMAPERNLRVVDNIGNPLPGVIVRQIWHQYSLDVHGEVDLITDSEGKVVTPKRVVRTSIISLFRGGIKKFTRLGIHASYSTRERIAVFVDDHSDQWFYDGKGLESGQIYIDFSEEIKDKKND